MDLSKKNSGDSCGCSGGARQRTPSAREEKDEKEAKAARAGLTEAEKLSSKSRAVNGMEHGARS